MGLESEQTDQMTSPLKTMWSMEPLGGHVVLLVLWYSLKPLDQALAQSQITWFTEIEISCHFSKNKCLKTEAMDFQIMVNGTKAASGMVQGFI